LFLLTDILGHRFINIQLLADQFSESGYYVVVPDLFKGDPVSLNPPEGFDILNDWFPRHVPKITRPIVDKAYSAIAEWKPAYIVGAGYCFGAKYLVQLMGEKKILSGAAYHPSFVSIEEIKAIKGNLYIAGAESDEIYTPELRGETEAALKEIGASYYTTLASGAEHGFSVRGDISKALVRFAKEQAFTTTIEWFAWHRPSK
jgi:dienelactone hydrolase